MGSPQFTPKSAAAALRPPRTPLGRPLWIFSAATALSLTGTFIQKIAVGWSVWEGTHATTWLAAASLADLLPTLLASVPAGALVDRLRPATTFWLSQVASCLQAVLLCALAASGHLTVAALLACAVFLGMCNAFTFPARLAYMTELTTRDCYPRAVVLYSLSGNAAFFAGPMIAGVLISAFGVSAAFAANALAYLPMIAVATMLPTVETRQTEPRRGERLFRQIRDGFAHAMQHRAILVMLLSFAAVACTARGIMELAPSIAAKVLHGGVGTLSLLASSIALGAFVAGIWMSQWGGVWRERATIIATLTGSSIGLIGYGASGQIALALTGGVLLGFMLAVNNISVTSAIQLHAAPQYRGRINSLYNMIFKGGPALGAAVFGWLAAFDVRLSSVGAAFVLVLLMLWIIGYAKTEPLTQPGTPSVDHGVRVDRPFADNVAAQKP
jgi:MFS family permease